MALFCIALIEGAKFLMQKGFANDDPMFWIYCFVTLGILIGRLSVYIEYEGKNSLCDVTRKLKNKSQNKKTPANAGVFYHFLWQNILCNSRTMVLKRY